MPENLIASTPSAYSYPLLVRQLLTNSLSLYGDQEITYRGEVRYAYRDFRRRVGQLASALDALGVRHGATVAVMDWDSHRYLESYFAIPMMGATLFTVNVRLAPSQIVYTLNDSQAETVLVHIDFLPMLDAVKNELTCVREVIVIADGQTVPTTGWMIAGEYEELVGRASPDYAFTDFDESTTAATFYTTGTTGDPKGVYYSHRQIVLHTMASAMALCSPRAGQRIHREDVYMPITPMFHVLAWGMPFVALTLGLKIVLPGRYVPGDLLELKLSEGVTFSHCVPTILQMLLNAADASGHDLSDWTMIIGGAKLPPALCRAATSKGMDVFAGYGMSETGPIVALAQIPPGVTPADADDDVRWRAHTGRPVPFVDFRVVDSEMHDVPRDNETQGEIVLRAPYLTQGYTRRPDASEELWAGGYLHTQDVAVVAPDGSVQIVDRIKDVIKTGGEWVSSIGLESLICELPGVQEAAVIGVKDEKWGERPMAFIVLGSEEKVDANEVRRHLLAHVDSDALSKYAVPEADRIVFVDVIPKTSVGKFDKKMLRAQHD
ncbi:fatty acid--CoA ligase [Tsukamurella soli]|uniref:Fatty acid--CoA ligase n=1 Tax=Tsukamurella soli TaxID=644556 RepID=A0ABP8JFS6_9ACTN